MANTSTPSPPSPPSPTSPPSPPSPPSPLIPEIISTGRAEFNFYYKEGTNDGRVYFQVKFKQFRSIIETAEYSLETLHELIMYLMSTAIITDRRQQDILFDWVILMVKDPKNIQSKHYKLGWTTPTSNSDNQQEIWLQNIYTKTGKIDSEYNGYLKNKLGTKGTLEDYLESLEKHVIGNVRIELAWILGFTGFIIQALQIEGQSDINISVNYTGKTSIGKTTVTKLSLTPFGNPNKLITSSNNTKSRVELDLHESGIIPRLVDDKLVQCLTSQELLIELMHLESGLVKGRYTDTEFTRDRRFYSPYIMSTETSIAEHLANSPNYFEGIKYRFIEIDCSKGLTDSGEHARQLDELMYNNYGLAGERFAEYLITEYSTVDIYNQYIQTIHNINNIQTINNIQHNQHRHSKRMGVILLTSELLNKCFNLHIDTNKIQGLLVESLNETSLKIDNDRKTILELYSLIEASQNLQLTQDPTDPTDIFDIVDITNKPDITETQLEIIQLLKEKQVLYGDGILTIKPVDLRKILYNELQIPDTSFNKLIKSWKNKGYIISGGKHGNTTKNTSCKTFEALGQKEICQVYIIDFNKITVEV